MQDIVFFIQENVILFTIWCFFFIVVLILIIKNILSSSKTINHTQVIKLINKENAIIIDTRSLELFKEGHIINSINIPLKNILSGDLKKIETYKRSIPIILVLDKINSNHECIKELSKNGFNNIHILKNGIDCWNLESLPLIREDK